MDFYGIIRKAGNTTYVTIPTKVRRVLGLGRGDLLELKTGFEAGHIEHRFIGQISSYGRFIFSQNAVRGTWLKPNQTEYFRLKILKRHLKKRGKQND